MPAGGWYPFHRERLKYDAIFAAELDYCYEKGLPHSYLLGNPCVFTPDDRDKLHAHILEKSSRCSLCGTCDWEWEQNRYAYEPIVEVCHGCQVKDLMREEATQPGSSISLVPSETAAKMRANKPAIPRRAPRSQS